MTMANHLKTRKNADGSLRYYWDPSKQLRQKGFSCITLPAHYGEAVRTAADLTKSAKNSQDKSQDAMGREIKLFNDLCTKYLTSTEYLTARPNTRYQYKSALGQLAQIFGSTPLSSFTAADISSYHSKVFKQFPAKANQHLAIMSLIFSYARLNIDFPFKNPAEKLKKPNLTPRQQLWPLDLVRQCVDAADTLGLRDLGTAIWLGHEIGQRPGDLCALTWGKYNQGRLLIQQIKTGASVSIPLLDDLRRRLDRAPRLNTTVLCNPNTGRAYSSSAFNRAWVDLRDKMAIDRPDILDLQFRDLRRTCVVNMGNAGATTAEITAITGHSDADASKILEIYMPRTSEMASNAMDKLRKRLNISSNSFTNQTNGSKRPFKSGESNLCHVPGIQSA